MGKHSVVRFLEGNRKRFLQINSEEKKQLAALNKVVLELNRLLPEINSELIVETLKATSLSIAQTYYTLATNDDSSILNRICFHGKRGRYFEETEENERV